MVFGKLLRGNRVNDYKTIFPTLTTFEKDIDTTIYNLFEEKAYYANGDGVVVSMLVKVKKSLLDMKLQV